MIFHHLDQRRQLNAFRIQECNEHRDQKRELRQDAQKYKGMLSEQREQRLEDDSGERGDRNNSKQPQNCNRGWSLER